MNFRSASKKNAPDGLDVSRYGDPPWRLLSPFVTPPVPLHIPGYSTYAADEPHTDFTFGDTVEGIWQGLKLIHGKTEEKLFQGPPRKRKGPVDGHDYGSYRVLGYTEAKALIYIPLYIALAKQRRDVLSSVSTATFVDVAYQPETLGPKPISHAQLLAEYLNGELSEYQAAEDRLVGLQTRLAAKTAEWSAAFKSDFEATRNREESAYIHELQEMSAKVVELQTTGINLATFEGCARLYERENLMLLCMRYCGCHAEITPWLEMRAKWVEHGILTETESERLSQRAPLTRWL